MGLCPDKDLSGPILPPVGIGIPDVPSRPVGTAGLEAALSTVEGRILENPQPQTRALTSWAGCRSGYAFQLSPPSWLPKTSPPPVEQ